MVWHRWPAVRMGLLVTVVAYFIYVHGYWKPPYLFWDENYHIASAQRYLHGTFFMEPHPPLGKLVIALGEALVSPQSNGDADQFVGTDYAADTPDGFSFAGYRLFPTLLAWSIAPMLFAVFWLLTANRWFAALLTSLYVFDNAIIVHSRSAMLEPTLEFFCLAMVLLFLTLLRWPDHSGWLRLGSLLLGACFAAALTTKLTGLVMAILYVPLAWRLARGRDPVRKLREALCLNGLGFLVVFVGVWQIHFALASDVHPDLPESGFYQASERYREILENDDNRSILHFPVMLRDSLAFVEHYQRGVPKLDLCKSEEDGSPWFFWPFGARAINYRWETPGGDDSAPYRYLYLQSNPVAWALGLLGVCLAAVLLLGSVLLPLRRPLEHRFELSVFFALWLGYMVAISRLDRVMYLYHYFLPLLFSYILFGLVVIEIRRLAGWKLDDRRRLAVLAACAWLVLGSFWFYSPLTYYQPLTDAEFERRALVRLWDLHCVRCERPGPLVRRSCS